MTEGLVLFAICNYDGRHVEGDPERPTEAAAAVREWVDQHRGCQTFTERPTGWPDAVPGVASNGHYKVALPGTRDRDVCGGCGGAPWPCEPYRTAASQCPQNGLGLAYPTGT